MLSSLGFDTKITGRNPRNGSSKYPDMPRGFSVHVFKSAPSSTPSYNTAANPEGAPPSGGGAWPKPSGYVSRSNFERKPSLAPPAPYRITQPVIYQAPFEAKRSKSAKSYGIYQNTTNDMYIYERSLSTASDGLASSSSSSSTDSDIVSESVVSASLEISSTRASSSTETLETTALTAQYAMAPARPALPRAASSSDWSQVTRDGARIYPPGLLTNPDNNPYRAGAPTPNPALLARPATVETLSDSDSDTFIDDEADIPASRLPSNGRTRDESPRDSRPTYPQPATAPSRRYSDERPSAQQMPRSRNSPDDYRNLSIPSAPAAPVQYRPGTAPNPRVPPGLPPTAGMAMDSRDLSMTFPPTSGSSGGSPPDARRPATLTREPSTSRQASTPPTSNVVPRSDAQPPKASPPSAAPPLTRQLSLRPDGFASLSSNSIPFADGPLTVATRRCVRWTEDLMCQCPLPRSERRRGWFNRRGDQLWTNEGRFKSPEPGMEYPPDLVGYPEPNAGWMNEEGVRIDMEHHLIPKPPLRSALKRPKVSQGSQ